MLEVVCRVSCRCLVISLLLDVFSMPLCTRLGFSHPLILGVSHCICNYPMDLMGIHFLCCAHGAKKITLHDVV